MSKAMITGPENDLITYDRDMFQEAKHIIQREQNKFWYCLLFIDTSSNDMQYMLFIKTNDITASAQMKKLW